MKSTFKIAYKQAIQIFTFLGFKKCVIAQMLWMAKNMVGLYKVSQLNLQSQPQSESSLNAWQLELSQV